MCGCGLGNGAARGGGAAGRGSRWHHSSAAPGELPWLRIRNARLSACCGWDSPGVSLAGIPAGGGGDSVRGRRSPRWGRHLGAHPCYAGSRGENPVRLGRATAAPLASLPSWRRRLLRPNSACSIAGAVVVHGWLSPVARHGGRCRSVARWGLLSPRGGGQYYAGCQGSSHVCWFWLLATDRGGWHCLAIVSSARDCVGGRRL